jgi:hypothetical protein
MLCMVPRNSLRMSRSWWYVPPRRASSAALSLSSALTRPGLPLSRSPLSQRVSLRVSRALAPHESAALLLGRALSVSLTQPCSCSDALLLGHTRARPRSYSGSHSLGESETSSLRVSCSAAHSGALDAPNSRNESYPPNPFPSPSPHSAGSTRLPNSDKE